MMAGTSASIWNLGPRIERATATTDGAGNAVFTWTPPFAGPPTVATTVAAGAGFRSTRIAANAGGSTTVAVLSAAGVTILGIGVLAAGTPAVGVQVHAIAVET